MKINTLRGQNSKRNTIIANARMHYLQSQEIKHSSSEVAVAFALEPNFNSATSQEDRAKGS